MRDPNQNGIQEIRIRNFKVFREKTVFDIRGRHVLVYGPNGSGKSSLYWAIYTLLQAITKSPGQTDKYFEFQGDEALLNIHQPAHEPSYIYASSKVNGNRHHAILTPQGLRVDRTSMTAVPYPANWLKETDMAAEFINHRQLIGFYNFANSDEINLINAFEDGFYPFFNGVIHYTTMSLKDALENIETNLSNLTSNQWQRKKRIEDNELANFNNEYGSLLTFAQQNVNRFLKKNFKNKNLRVSLRPRGRYYIAKQNKKWVVIRPMIKLTVGQVKEDGTYHEIDRPQSFLNEALLTRIGVAIRFALLKRRPQNLPLKLLLMDDLLVSMDMDNRANLMEIIERRYERNYQLFIFTHDRALYNELRRKTADDISNWAIYEVNQGKFKNAKSELEKAKIFLEEGDFDSCALELRKLAEILLRQYLKGIDPTIFSDKKFRSLGSMIEMAYKSLNESTLKQFDENLIQLKLTEEDLTILQQDDFTNFMQRPIPQKQKQRILKARTTLFALADNATKAKRKALDFLKQVQHIKDKILNQGAHASDEVTYKAEMLEAVEIFESFKKTLFAKA